MATQDNKVNVAIIGCGTIATTHAKGISKCENIEISYCCDLNLQRAEKMAKEYGGTPIDDYHVILKDEAIKAVHILTPHYLHYPMALEALEAGKNVILEKPATMKMEHLKHLIQVEKESGKQVGVAFQNRLNPTTVKLKEELEAGTIGQVKGIKAFVTWFRDDAYYDKAPWRSKWSTSGGGHLINQGIHTVDLMQYFGGPIKNIQGHIANHGHKASIEVEDTAEIVLEFENGAKGLYYGTNNHCEDSRILLEVVGENGILRISGSKLWLLQNNDEKVIAKDFSSKDGKCYWGSSHSLLIHTLYEQMEQGAPVEIGLEDALPSLKILSALYDKTSLKRHNDE